MSWVFETFLEVQSCWIRQNYSRDFQGRHVYETFSSNFRWLNSSTWFNSSSKISNIAEMVLNHSWSPNLKDSGLNVSALFTTKRHLSTLLEHSINLETSNRYTFLLLVYTSFYPLLLGDNSCENCSNTFRSIICFKEAFSSISMSFHSSVEIPEVSTRCLLSKWHCDVKNVTSYLKFI